MWSWDAAFVAMGLAQMSAPARSRRCAPGRCAVGFRDDPPHRLLGGTRLLPGRAPLGHHRGFPPGVLSSGICQPPVHAIALRFILDAARAAGGQEQDDAERFLRETFDGWLRWHRWLATARDPRGWDCSRSTTAGSPGWTTPPRFDGPYSRVQPGELAPYERTDLKHADASERPSAEEYDRYLWLVQQMAEVGFDDKRVLEVVDFRVRDVFMSGVMSTAWSSPTSPTSWAGVTTRPTNACWRRGSRRAWRPRSTRKWGWPGTTTCERGSGSPPRPSPASHRWCGLDDEQVRGRQWGSCGERWLAHPASASPSSRPRHPPPTPTGRGPTGGGRSGRS